MRKTEYKKMKRLLSASILLATVLTGCTTANNAQDSGSVSGSESVSAPDSSVQESKTASAAAEKTGAGKRIPVTLYEALQKKNADEQFVLLYTKNDCEYCAQFDEILNPYLEEHPLTIYEVSLTEAEAMYPDDERETMLNYLTAGVNRTPALYFIESQENVNLLDHTEDNYSLDGLRQFVEKYDLESLY